MPWLHRAGPSATLDKACSVTRNSIPRNCERINWHLDWFLLGGMVDGYWLMVDEAPATEDRVETMKAWDEIPYLFLNHRDAEDAERKDLSGYILGWLRIQRSG